MSAVHKLLISLQETTYLMCECSFCHNFVYSKSGSRQTCEGNIKWLIFGLFFGNKPFRHLKIKVFTLQIVQTSNIDRGNSITLTGGEATLIRNTQRPLVKIDKQSTVAQW